MHKIKYTKTLMISHPFNIATSLFRHFQPSFWVAKIEKFVRCIPRKSIQYLKGCFKFATFYIKMC